MTKKKKFPCIPGHKSTFLLNLGPNLLVLPMDCVIYWNISTIPGDLSRITRGNLRLPLGNLVESPGIVVIYQDTRGTTRGTSRVLTSLILDSNLKPRAVGPGTKGTRD